MKQAVLSKIKDITAPAARSFGEFHSYTKQNRGQKTNTSDRDNAIKWKTYIYYCKTWSESKETKENARYKSLRIGFCGRSERRKIRPSREASQYQRDACIKDPV